MGFLSKINKLVDPLGLDLGHKKLVGALDGGKKGGGNILQQYGPEALAALDKKYPQYRQAYNNAGGAGGLGGRSYEQWLTDHFNRYPGNSDNAAALSDLQKFSETGNFGDPDPNDPANQDPNDPNAADGGATIPTEQGLYNLAQPGILADIEKDKERRNLADALGRQSTFDAKAARETIASAQGPTFDYEKYFAANPDVAQFYANSDHAMTPQEFAQYHYNNYGKNEGRQGAEFTSLLQRDNANADRTTQALSDSAALSGQQQLQALAHYVTEMKGSLDGELRQRAEALEAQIHELGTNLDSYDQAQKTALAKQIETEGHALEASIGEQKDNLNTQIAALRDANGAQGQARMQALNTELKGLRNSNSAQDQARKKALLDEITGLQNANTEQGQARLQALQEEADKLHTAQQPVAQARLAGANNAVTAVNIALQRKNDTFQDTQAQQGYIGGSTTQDAAMATASIDARQRAAELMAAAREKNAVDMRDVDTHTATEGRSVADAIAQNKATIAARQATEGRSLADTFAGNESQIANRGAMDTRTIAEDKAANEAGIAGQAAAGTRTLSDALATGKQGITSFGASEGRKIDTSTAAGRLSIGNMGTTTRYADALYGGAEGRKIADTGSSGTFGINTSVAQQQQQARNAGAVAKSSYYDADYQRRLGTALQLPGITNGLTSSLTNLDNYANSGLTRGLNTLNWWSANASPSTPGFVQVNPDQSGSNLSSLGVGLVGSAINIGNANKWWQTPSSQPVISNVSAPPISNNPSTINASLNNLNTGEVRAGIG